MVVQSEKTKLDNSTYNILVALGIEADFIHSTVDTYTSDAQTEDNTKLVEVWNMIKHERIPNDHDEWN